MIIDRIEEQERYYPIHPDMELAFAFLAEAPDLEPGRYELEDGLFAILHLRRRAHGMGAHSGAESCRVRSGA